MNDLYVDRNYSKYLNQDIIVIGTTDMLPKVFCAKFLDFTDKKKLNDHLDLLMRKPIEIKVSMCPQLKVCVTIRKDQYSAVISKELLDLFDILLNRKNIPKEIGDDIKKFIPEYGRLF